MTLYITIVNLNCEPLKQGLKIYMVFFIKYILYIHLTKESCKHFNFPPLLVLGLCFELIEFDSHAHLVSKAGSVIGTKSPSPVFKLSGS